MFLRLVLRVNSSMLPLNSAFVACRFRALSGEQVEALPPALAQQEEMQALRNLEGFVLVSNRVRGSCACFSDFTFGSKNKLMKRILRFQTSNCASRNITYCASKRQIAPAAT